MNLDAFHPFVLTEVMGCPIPLLNARIVASASDFCRETLSWTETQSMTTMPGVADYELDSPTNSYALTVTGVWSGARILVPVSQDIVSSEVGSPSGYNMLGEFGVMRLYPVPAEAEALTVKLSYAPTPTATTLPDFLVRFTDVIASGAKAELMAMPQVEWSNPNLAAYYAQKFQSGIANSRIADFHGRVVGPIVVRPRLFGS